MINPFERFYDTSVEVFNGGEVSYEGESEKTYLASVICDIQPLSDDTDRKLYGLSSQRSYKLFCDKNDFIKKGRYIRFGGEWYLITSVMDWSFGMTAVMRGEGNEA